MEKPLLYRVSFRIVNLVALFSDLPGLFNVLWKSSVLKEGQDWGHPVAFILDCKGKDLFSAGTFLDLNL